MLLGGKGGCQQCGCVTASCVCNIYDAAVIGVDNADQETGMASMFLTGSSSFLITSIQLRTPDWSTYPSSFVSGAKLRIWSHSTSSGGIPNAPLHTLTYPATLTDDVTFTTLGYTVSADTKYWVVLDSGGYWEYTDHNSCIDGTVPYCQIRWARGIDYSSPPFGSSVIWSPSDGGPYAFRIFGEEV